MNFQIAPEELLHWYPLHRVREMHISGGSWEDSKVTAGRKIRRDTHDETVPGEVFDLLEKAVPQCPNLKYVVLEQLASGLASPQQQESFREDFHRLQKIVASYSSEASSAARIASSRSSSTASTTTRRVAFRT